MALALTGLALTACGGGEDAGVASLDAAAVASTPPEAAILTMEESVLAFTPCLRDRGLEVSDPVLPTARAGSCWTPTSGP